MGTIKILQLSDLLLHSSGCKVQEILNSFREGIIDQLFDYIVVCGNLTRDGSQESFRIARQFLEELANRVLFDKASKLRRIIIVPGRSDVLSSINNNDNFDAFKQFYSELFSDEIRSQRVQEFHPRRATLRNLKDLTFISAYYWNQNGEASHSLEELTSSVIDNLELNVSQLKYCNKTPTIFVSSGTPILSWNTGDRIQGSSLNALLKDTLKVSLHLFGAGNVVHIPPQPFSFDYVSLGTGPRVSEEIWPLRMNFIEIETGVQIDEVCEPFISAEVKVTAFRKPNLYQAWERGNFTALQSPLLQSPLTKKRIDIQPSELSRNIICSTILAQIKEGLLCHRPGLFLVQGFPGCGKNIIRDILLKEGVTKRTWRDKTYLTASGTWENYKDSAEVFNSIHKDLTRQPNTEDAERLALIFDFAFGKKPQDDQLENLREIQNNLRPLWNDNVVTVYVIDPGDVPSSFERDFVTKFVVPPLTTETLDTLVNQYSCFAPIINEHINWMTGRYAGFSYLLLNDVKEKFKKFKGAELVQEKTSWALIKNALSSEELENTTSEFLRCIEGKLGGSDVCRYIRIRVQRHIEQIQSETPQSNGRPFQELESTSILITPSELENSIDIKKRSAALRVLGFLEEFGILRKQENSDDYELCVTAPFLKIVETYTVFISYISKYEEKAKSLIHEIEKLALEEGKKVNPLIFIAQEAESTLVSKQIDEKIDESRNFVLICEGTKFDSLYVVGEVKRWTDKWRQKLNESKAALIPISMDRPERHSHVIAGCPIIYVQNGDIQYIAREVLSRLVPE